MRKIGSLLVVIFFVGIAYLFILAAQPTINAMVETANSSANWTTYPTAQPVVQGFPFWIYFVPAGVGFAAVVAILRSKNE